MREFDIQAIVDDINLLSSTEFADKFSTDFPDGFRLHVGKLPESSEVDCPAIYAYQDGGHLGLQFNVGDNRSCGKILRHGVAISLKSQAQNENIKIVQPKYVRFRDWLLGNINDFPEMDLWMWDGPQNKKREKERDLKTPPEQIRAHQLIFWGKKLQISKVGESYMRGIVDDFIRLLPLYRYVEGRG